MEAEYAAAYPRLYREHWWWRVREHILVRKIRQILKGSQPGARILDVGCGSGLFFDALEEFGHVEGIESERLAVEQSGRWRSRIQLGAFDDAFRPGHSFDLILLLDVLEHVDHPDDLLRRARDLSSPNGRILATVPAFEWLWTSHDELSHHKRRYTATELRGLLNGAGLTVVEMRYLFQSLMVPKLFVWAKETLRPSSPGVPRVPSPALNHALQLWYRLEYAIAGWLPFGSSVMAVARRSSRPARSVDGPHSD